MIQGTSYAVMVNNSSNTINGVRIDFGGTGKFSPKTLNNKDFSNKIQAKIFPSPSELPSFTFAYDTENEEKNTLELLNLCGQTVFRQDNISNHAIVNLPSNTPSGIYFVRFTANEKTAVLRWVLR
jgi:hypothetical protein